MHTLVCLSVEFQLLLRVSNQNFFRVNNKYFLISEASFVGKLFFALNMIAQLGRAAFDDKAGYIRTSLCLCLNIFSVLTFPLALFLVICNY